MPSQDVGLSKYFTAMRTEGRRNQGSGTVVDAHGNAAYDIAAPVAAKALVFFIVMR